MNASQQPQSSFHGRHHRATLTASRAITPASAREEVRELSFRCDDLEFDGRIGQCIRILAPGQFGNPFHPRLYSMAEVDRSQVNATDFRICVRRCFTIDDFNGERHPGVASNYLCDLPVGSEIAFNGPVGYPFSAPDDPTSPLLMIGMGTGIAPFRGLIRSIYESRGGWQAPVRLFHGARSGLEMIYRNEQADDLSLYMDQPTFQAFAAVSPRPHFDEPVAIQEAIAAHATEVWAMLENPMTHVFVAGSETLLPMIERPLAEPAGDIVRVRSRRAELMRARRWTETLY